MTVNATTTLNRYVQQAWRDLLSVYYANTPTWRWLKSGALVFLGGFAWMGAAVILSVRPEWGLLTYVMAYGFLLILWGPLTHMVVVPLTIRLRRTANHPITRSFSRNSGKINLTVFFTLVLLFGAFTPSLMMLEFSSDLIGGEGTSVSGNLVCDTETEEDLVTCHVENPQGIDHITVEAGGETIAESHEEPFEVTFDRADAAETRTGLEVTVTFRDADGERLQRFVEPIR